MKIAKGAKKCCWSIVTLTVAVSFGCVGTPVERAAWPWENGKSYDMAQTGDYIGITGGVAQFGGAPKAAKPVSAEAVNPPAADLSVSPPPIKALAKTADTVPVPAPTVPGASNKASNGEYDFSVRSVNLAPASYLSGALPTNHAVTAFNHGNAPVSVAVNVDAASSQNWSCDKEFPIVAVISPNTDSVVVNFKAKSKGEPVNVRYSYTWSLGDFSARHQSPEHYLLPFGNDVIGVAQIHSNQTPLWDRYSAYFAVPVGTPVLAARKGTVVRISADGKVKVVHDDSTIASYEFHGKIAEGLFVGQALSTQDVIGTAGTPGNEATYFTLTVWHPELRREKTSSGVSSAGFEMVTIPIEFCSADIKVCRVLTPNEKVSRNLVTEKKNGKRKHKSASR